MTMFNVGQTFIVISFYIQHKMLYTLLLRGSVQVMLQLMHTDYL